MAEKLDEKELVSFRELLNSQMALLDTVSQILIEKGIVTEEEFFDKLNQVKQEYEERKAVKG